MARLPWFRRSHKAPDRALARPPVLPYVITVGADGSLSALKDADLMSLLGLGQSGVDAGTPMLGSDETGMAMAYVASEWAFRCLEVRALKVAELLNEAQIRDRTTDQVVEHHPFNEALDRAYTHYHQDFFYTYVMSLNIFGEVYTEKIPSQLWHMPFGMRVLPALAIKPIIINGEIQEFDFMGEDRTVQFPPDQIAYDFTFNPFNTLRGLSPLKGAMNAVNLDLYVQRHNTVYFRNGARPGLIIAPKVGEIFNDDDFEKIKTWLKQNKGVDSFYKAFTLNRPMDVNAIDYPTLEDQRFLTDDQRRRICAKLGVPEGLVAYGGEGYQLTPEQRILFHENTVIPQAKNIARFINKEILPYFDPQSRVRLALDQKRLDALVEDETARDEMIRNRYLNGQITFNEMRRELRMKPFDEGTDFLMPAIGHRLVSVEDLPTIIHQEAINPTQPQGQGLTARPPDPDAPRREHEYHPPSLHPGGIGAGNSNANGNRPLSLNPSRSVGKGSFGTPEGTVILYLEDTEALLTMQQIILRGVERDIPDIQVRWTPIDQLHVTLAHAPLVDDKPFRETFLEVQDAFTGLALKFTNITTFGDGKDALPVVLLVEKTPELVALQKKIVDAFEKRNIPLSEYSQPDAWTPHITLAYVSGDVVKARDYNFDLPAEDGCLASVMAFTRGNYEIIDVTGMNKPDTEKPARNEDTSEPQDDELKTWRRVAMRRGRSKAVDFVATALPGTLASALRMNLTVTDDDRDALADVFARAAFWLDLARGEAEYDQGKAIQATRIEFEDAFRSVLSEARSGKLSRRRWAGLARSLVRKWGARAYLDGLADGGLDPDDPLTADDTATINRLSAEQSEYVTALGDKLFSDQGVTDGQAEHKPEMWFNKSLMPFYNAGRLSADQNGMYGWAMGDTEDHCASCLTADGQKHRLKEWFESGVVPQSDQLECHGFECKCQLYRTKGRASGSLAAVPLLEGDHVLV